MDHDAESFNHLFDGFQISSAVPVIAVDQLGFIAARRDVVDGVGILTRMGRAISGSYRVSREL